MTIQNKPSAGALGDNKKLRAALLRIAEASAMSNPRHLAEIAKEALKNKTQNAELDCQWWTGGFGLNVFSKLTKRAMKGWEDGVVHQNGINDGHWVINMRSKHGVRLAQILSLYENEKEFLND